MGFYKDINGSVAQTVMKFKKVMPAIGFELEHLCEDFSARGERIDFSEKTLDALDRLVEKAAGSERNSLEDSGMLHSFMFRNREIIGRLGTFLGCIVIENLGGKWRRDDGGLVVDRAGNANIRFDPYQAVIRAIIEPRGESLSLQYENLKNDIDGNGPMVLFREKVIEELRKRRPGISVGRVSGLKLWLTDGTKINLENLYATARRTRNQADRAVEEFVEVVCALESNGAEMPEFEQAYADIFPVLKTRAFLERNLGNGKKVEKQLVWDEFYAGLVICYVFEKDGCFRFVRNSDAEKWKTTPEELERRAISNLDCCSRGLDHGIAETEHGSVIVVNENDGYDAARILLPGLNRDFAPHLGESFVVAVPCRDLLVAFERKAGLISFMKRWIRDDAHMGAYGLTDALFVCDRLGTMPLE